MTGKTHTTSTIGDKTHRLNTKINPYKQSSVRVYCDSINFRSTVADQSQLQTFLLRGHFLCEVAPPEIPHHYWR